MSKLFKKKTLLKNACILLALLLVVTAINVTAGVASPKNIALKAAVYADTGDFYLDNSLGSSALHDNKTNTFFSSTETTNQNKNETVTLVLDGTYTLDSISLIPRGTTRNGIPVDFTISVYNGSGWEEIDRKTDNSETKKVYTKQDIGVSCTAVRLAATKLSMVDDVSKKYALQLAEFQVFGVKSDIKLASPVILTDTMNVAKDSAVTLDVPDWAQKDFSAKKLTDGIKNSHKNFTTTGSLAENAVQDVYLIFDGVYTVERIALYPAMQTVGGTLKYVGGFPVDYTLCVWDGLKWCEVASDNDVKIGNFEGNAEVTLKQYNFSAIDTNAVRLTVHKNSAVNQNGTDFALRLAEMEVYGVCSSETDLNEPAVFTDYRMLDLSNGILTDENKSVEYAFSKSFEVCEVIVGALENAQIPQKFNVSLWDGKEWKQIAKKDSYNLSKEKLYIAADDIVCRGVRLSFNELLDASATEDISLTVRGTDAGALVDVSGQLTNAAKDASVEMECPDWAQSAYGPSNLVNGNLNDFATTSYMSDKTRVKTATLFLSKAYEVQTVNLYPRLNSQKWMANGGFPEAFKINVWNGKAWQTVKTVSSVVTSGEKYPVYTIELDSAVLCNTVQIETVTLGNSDNPNVPYVLQLSEVEILGTESTEKLKYPNDASEAGENAALGGTVEMNVPSWATSFPATKLVDGITAADNNFATTEYVTDQNSTQSVTVLFKNGAYNLNSIKMFPRMKGSAYQGGFPKDFKVSVWNGSAWVEVYKRTGVEKNTADVLAFSVNPTVCNALKIDVTRLGESENKGKYCLQLAEIEAWGEKSETVLPYPKQSAEKETESGVNAALNSSVEMNTPKWASSFPASNVTDGKTSGNSFCTTEYVDKADTDESVAIIFKNGAHRIDKIKLYPRSNSGKYQGGFPKDFKVSVWNGSAWVEVYKRTGVEKNSADVLSFTINPTECNALKIDVTKLGESENKGKYCLQLAEIEAWGEKSSANLAAPKLSGGSGANSNTVTIDNSRNLALNKPVKASSDLSQYGAPAIKVNDGSLYSYWASNDTKFVKGEPQWVEINLLNNFAVNTVVLGARQQALGFPIDFDIEVFYDGKWIKAFSQTGFNANEKAGYSAYEFTFPAVIGNKIRVSSANFKKVQSSNSMVLAEVAVYGNAVSGNYVLPNDNMITSGVGITATSSMEDYDYYLIHLIDNKLTTGFSTVPAVDFTEQSVEVDMKCEIQLSEIQLKPSEGGYGFPIDFTISAYKNGNWVDVYSVTDFKQPEDEAIARFQFDTVNATKFRITAHKLPKQAGLYVWKMNEILAFPSHTGDEFDPQAIEIVLSSEKPEAAQTITLKKSKDSYTEIIWWKTAVGAAGILIAVFGCALMFLLLKKKNNISR